MMQPFEFKNFWSKYGNFVLIGLFFLMIVNECNREVRYTALEKDRPNAFLETNPQSDDHDLHLKSYEELMQQRRPIRQDQPNSFFTFMWLLIMGAVVVWLFSKPWWKRWRHRLFPGRVNFKVEKVKDRITRRWLLKISVQNNTREGITFLAPMVVFRKWDQERRFRLKSSDQEDMFPITLTGGTSHQLVIDLDHFYEKLPDLKKSNRVGAVIETTSGKIYKRFVLPGWINFLIK
ncbi:hypothetical protein ACT29H_02670 [Thermophagus sp. OGC60D27]|uniref:hypothetical protein n=1 Tax=Thermophagus sp. OGC60D27 TaxID=3458415 RepID=UPI004037E70F